MKVFIEFLTSHLIVICDDDSTTSIVERIKKNLSIETLIPSSSFALYYEGDIVLDDLIFSSESELYFLDAIFCEGIRGGKGGFGAALRRAAKQAGPKKTTDFGACRDLSGRRIRHVNDEIILQKWQEAKDRNEDFNVDEETPSGISLWFLPTPSWAEGFGKKVKNKRRKQQRKTQLCSDWLHAHQPGRYVPPNAPLHWGCPRGARCDYAHGESDLTPEAHKVLLEENQKKKIGEESEKLHTYLKNDDSGDDLTNDFVLTGLKRVIKKRKFDPVSVFPRDGDVAPSLGSPAVNLDTLGKGNDDSLDEDPSPSPTPIESQGCSWLSVKSGDPAIMSDGTVIGRDEFGTVAVTVGALGAGPREWGDVFLSEGSYYYEVELQSDGLIQIGWAQPNFNPRASAGDGVGDDKFSWAYDGCRNKLWHGTPQDYGYDYQPADAKGEGKDIKKESDDDEEYDNKFWKSGDVIGCSINIQPKPPCDASEGTRRVVMVYYRNGASLGTAFDFELNFGFQDSISSNNVTKLSGFYPALSVDSHQKVKLNVGQEPFKHLPQPKFHSVGRFSLSKDSSSSTAALFSDSTSSVSNLISEIVVAEKFDPLQLESEMYESVQALEALGPDRLKQELSRRGLKCGGTTLERARRLHSVRGLEDKNIPSNLKQKKS